jgi:hypothetical protein
LVPSQQSPAMVFVDPPFILGERLFCTSPLHGAMLLRDSGRGRANRDSTQAGSECAAKSLACTVRWKVKWNKLKGLAEREGF